MNIDVARQAIRDFVNLYVPIYRWDLDYPDILYYNRSGFNIFANTAIELPLLELATTKNGNNGVLAKARFPYRVTWIFDGNQPVANLPFKAVEGVVSNIQVLALVKLPHPDLKLFQPYQEPDPVTISRTEDESNDWLLSANFSFNAEFQITTFANTDDLTEPGFYELPDPVPVTSIGIGIYKAKINFSRDIPDTYKKDNQINITS